MNNLYKIRYDNFISSRKLRTIPKNVYTENHHIIHKSLGGSDEDENLIILTAREHYIAHLMLWKVYGKQMTQAFYMMCGFTKYKNKLTSKQYEQLKKEMKHTEETKKKIGKANKGRKIKIKQSVETRRKRAESNRGQKRSDETRKKMSITQKGKNNANYGNTHNIETKRKMSKSHKENPSKSKGMKDKKHSEETKRKISEKVKKTLQDKKLLI